ncbi:MAG: nitroreductase family protein [Coprococcus sp.]
MEAAECIKTRRSVRKYTGEMVPKETIREIVELASYSPSWKNTQVIRYILVENEDIIERIANEGVMNFPLNQKTVSRAKQLMIITKKDAICGYEKDGSYSTSKENGWEMFDAGIATQTFCLAAHEKGVGTVILGVFDDKIVGDIVGIPDGQTVAAIVAMGYPAFAPEMPPRKNVDELLTFK